ncbi:MAG: rhomboid family intramembrane serine protease [Phycisphaerales bacterium]
MLFPVAYDVPLARYPWMNWVLMSLCGLGYLWGVVDEDATLPFILGVDELAKELGLEIHQSPLAWIVHMFLHANFMHLAGNMIFMWVFGNAACAKLGQWGYLALWLGAGLVSAVAEPYGLGASGAINGAVGFCLVFYPLNDITMFWWLIRGGTFAISGYWMILLWCAFDILGIVSGPSDGIAYLSHVVGLASGAGAAIAVIKLGWIEADEDERTLLEVWASRGKRAKSGTARAHSATLGTRRLKVRMPSGIEKELPVVEFLRHESQGKQVNHFSVSEDGEHWTTFGEWRASAGV